MSTAMDNILDDDSSTCVKKLLRLRISGGKEFHTNVPLYDKYICAKIIFIYFYFYGLYALFIVRSTCQYVPWARKLSQRGA